MAVDPRFDTHGISIYVECEQHKYYKLPPLISFEKRYESPNTPTEAVTLYFYIEFPDNSSNFIYRFIDEYKNSAPHWLIVDSDDKYILFSDIVDYCQYDYHCKLILKNNGLDTWMAHRFDFLELVEDLKMAEELVPYCKLRDYWLDTNGVNEPSFDLYKRNNNIAKEIELMYGSNSSKPFVNLPVISDIYYISPYTTVKWMDGTTTTVKASKDDEFNKEYGLAMAIAKKYYECLEAPNPRAAFKKAAYKDAHDQTEKTAQKRAYKEEKKKRNKRGRISSSKKTSKR